MVFHNVKMLNESHYLHSPLMAYSITLNFDPKLQNGNQNYNIWEM